MIFVEFFRWWLLELNNIVKPMSEPTLPSAKIYYFDFKCAAMNKNNDIYYVKSCETNQYIETPKVDFDKVKKKIVDILPGVKQHNTVNEYEWFTKGTNEYDSTIMVWLPNTMLNDMHINALKEEFGAKFVCFEADSLHNGDDCLHLIIHNISNIRYYK